MKDRLSSAVHGISRGKSFRAWAEDEVASILLSARETEPPINLEGRLLKTRRISDIVYRRGLSERGRLIPTGRGFRIELDIRVARPGTLDNRMILAHEIAHTVFYDLEATPPTPRVALSPGDVVLERACRQIALRLLVPKAWLLSSIANQPTPGQGNFDLRILDSLALQCRVATGSIAERLIEHLAVWQVVMLIFHKRNDSNGRLSWRLVRTFCPKGGLTGLYLPNPSQTSTGETKFPRARGRLSALLDNIDENDNTETTSREIPVTELAGATTGNLSSFLARMSGSLVSAKSIVYRPRQQPFLESKQIESSITLCFPLANGDDVNEASSD